MIVLKEALPFLVIDLESALAHIGRGDVVNQLREVTIDRWTYDEHSDSAYVHFQSPEGTAAAEAAGEGVSVYEELGINLDTDAQGRLTGMDILGAQAIVAQLESYIS